MGTIYSGRDRIRAHLPRHLHPHGAEEQAALLYERVEVLVLGRRQEEAHGRWVPATAYQHECCSTTHGSYKNVTERPTEHEFYSTTHLDHTRIFLSYTHTNITQLEAYEWYSTVHWQHTRIVLNYIPFVAQLLDGGVGAAELNPKP